MFGGIHPLGDVDNWFWSFMIYLFTQLLWIAPIILFFASIISWGWMREKLALATALAGWAINLLAVFFIFFA